MLNIILVYSGLEMIPKELWCEKEVLKYCKKRKKDPGKCILDISKLPNSIKKLKEWWMRGRPDIVHLFLLNALDSILNIENKLRVFIHTRNDKIIYVKPETRIPRNYNRFLGLMEVLFEKKYVPNKENWLLKLENKKLSGFLKENNFDIKVLMWEKGEFKKPIDIAKELLKFKNPIVMIGGFQKGDFPKWILNLADKKYCIYKNPLSSATILNEIIINYEIFSGPGGI